MESSLLTDREETVLGTIIRDYMVMASPEGSRMLSKKSGLDLSPASIRNIVSDLEEKGYVEQPHTSAGRIPTDKGYRYYVDYLIQLSELTGQEKESIEMQFDVKTGSFEAVAAVTSRILSSLSHQLGLVLSPRFYNGVFRKLSVIEVAEKKLMLVLTIESGLVNSIVVEVEFTFSSAEISVAVDFINQRLSGRKLSDIEQYLSEMMHTDDKEKVGIIRLFTDNYSDLSNFPIDKIIHLSGTSNIIGQPEFEKKKNIEAVIELLENKEMLIHILENKNLKAGVNVTIGHENPEESLSSYSLVSSNYQVGDVTGALGVIGPKRMVYHKLIPVVSYTAGILSKKYSSTFPLQKIIEINATGI